MKNGKDTDELVDELAIRIGKEYFDRTDRRGLTVIEFYRQRSLELLVKDGFRVVFDDGQKLVILSKNGEVNKLYKPKIYDMIGLETPRGGIAFVDPTPINDQERYQIFFQIVTAISKYVE